MVCLTRLVLLLVLVNITLGALYFGGKPINSRRKAGKVRSTSSSSGEKKEKDRGDKTGGTSLGLEFSGDSTSTDTDEKRYKVKKKSNNEPKSSLERKGWRKWHRKCQQCPDDMKMKWRDPRIKWICGGYQRARRSFKSLCMMHYRNCQDGTMFTKIGDHRCKNTSKMSPHGEHFFYDYKVKLSDEGSTDSKDKSSSTESESETTESSSWDTSKIEAFEERHAHILFAPINQNKINET
ncbi:uncharacterized protein LOC142982072 [Anticarsia gemmatalis]|uniref:uncharacterized protein LOC142982072 n=1 Tax=Anticarsia gemmatalis TaxID=129554 RepID=UPI003F7716B8